MLDTAAYKVASIHEPDVVKDRFVILLIHIAVVTDRFVIVKIIRTNK